MKTIQSKDCPECGNDFWSASERTKTKSCHNCGHEESYSPKSPRPERGTTKSQKKKLDKIREYFEGRDNTSVDVWIEEHLDWGPLSLTVKTNDSSMFLRASYAVLISRRGKVTVLTAEGFSYPDSHKEHFADMIGGHVQNT